MQLNDTQTDLTPQTINSTLYRMEQMQHGNDMYHPSGTAEEKA